MNEDVKTNDIILDPVPEGVIPVDEWVYGPGDEAIRWTK